MACKQNNLLMVTSTISVSSPTYLDCSKLAEFLSSSGCVTNVSSNISIVPNTVKFDNSTHTVLRREYGCRLIQSIQSKDEIQNIWNILKKEYGFNCAHINVGNHFDGCILDYLAPTQCGK